MSAIQALRWVQTQRSSPPLTYCNHVEVGAYHNDTVYIFLLGTMLKYGTSMNAVQLQSKLATESLDCWVTESMRSAYASRSDIKLPFSLLLLRV